MKKKLLFCIHNYFFLKHYILDLKELEKYFEITIITSNYLIKNKEIEYESLKKEFNFKDFFIVPFYKKNLERSLLTIFQTHLFLSKLKKKVLFEEFDIYVSDSNFFIWMRIISEKFLSGKCKKIGVTTGSLALNLSIFKKILCGENVKNYVNNLHKLREVISEKRKKEKSYFKKFLNIKKKFLETIIDRYFFSYLFYFKNLKYKKYDLNLMETDQFDLKIVFHYANYIFWRNWYDQKKNVILSYHKSDCKCQNKKKGKIIFLSSLLWSNNENEISNQVDRIINFLNIKTKEDPNISELSIRHHPMENKVETINKIFTDKFKDKIRINFVENSKPLEKIVCEYDYAFGMISTALNDVKKACNKIEVYCLKSLSTNELGEDYFLKLFNEDIIFYDDYDKKIDENVKKFDQYKREVNQKKFSDVLKNL
tara:strand:+ start:10790 stop:12064 length:1275 start_codon:yes stop_codon:yes gene_type:complete